MQKIAFYMRLSVEDIKTQSQSIQSQRALLYDIMADYSEYANYTIQEYIDNGYSGTNFERPVSSTPLRAL
ncbi:MAG: hypothetical protein BEN18_01920 [Epulopiscium sp. Nuni2H_MBin001]|nr:MAG: hypothetical protein BEN18_01920 [Epulopiscium sp. Nuni2H_MBin001]